jgi:hypothetical protein
MALRHSETYGSSARGANINSTNPQHAATNSQWDAKAQVYRRNLTTDAHQRAVRFTLMFVSTRRKRNPRETNRVFIARV